MATYTSTHEIAGLGGTSRASFYNLLKDVYGPMWDLHVMTQVKINKLIGKRMGVMGGRKKVTAFRSNLPQSAGLALFEGARLPTPKSGTYANPELLSRDKYGRLRWTGQAERAARRGKKHAWAGPRKTDMEDAEKQFDLNWSRNLYLGPTDILGTTSAASTNATVHVGDRNSRDSDVGDWFRFGARYLSPGMAIDFVRAADAQGAPLESDENNYTVALGDTAGTANNEAIFIASIDRSTPTAVTFECSRNIVSVDSFTPAINDFIIMAGSRKSSITAENARDESFAAMNGLLNIASAQFLHASLYGLSKTTYPSLEGTHNHNSGTQRAYSENLLTLISDLVHDNGTGEEIDCYLMNRAVRREHVAEVAGDRRFQPVQTNKGFAKLQHTAGDVPVTIETDHNCPPGVVWALCKKNFGFFSEEDMHFLDERFVDSYDKKELVFHKSGNIECPKPFNQGLLDDIRFDIRALT